MLITKGTRPEEDPYMIHVLGAGGIGCLAATRIPGSTLILRNKQRLYQYRQVDETVTISGDQELACRVPGTLPELMMEGSVTKLIIATKAGETAAALAPVAPKLAPNPTVLVLQNGIGSEEAVKRLVPGADVGFAITSQGMKQTAAVFRFEQSGLGEFLYSFPNAEAPAEAAPRRYIPGFTPLGWPQFQTARLQKLLINSVVNPLTALLRCKNGALVDEKFRYLMQPVVRESCAIVNAAFGEQFSPEAVMDRVLAVAEATRNNTSSMLADVVQGRPTEIEYINGALVELGRGLGLKTSQNAMLAELVRAGGTGEEGLGTA